MARRATNVSGHVSQSKKPQERKAKPESVLMQDGLSESVQKAELNARVTELEGLPSGTRRDLELAKVTIRELESKVSQSSSKINELQSELSKSVPTDDLEAVKAQLESKSANLEQQLAASVPRSELNQLRTTITDLEMKLSQYVPKSEVDALNENASRLKATLTETREKLTLAETKGRELNSKLSESISRTELEAAKTAAETKISEIQTQLSESRIEANALREKLAGREVTENELEAPVMPIEELGSAEPPGVIEEDNVAPSCPSCNASTLQDDIYCGNCGTLL